MWGLSTWSGSVCCVPHEQDGEHFAEQRCRGANLANKRLERTSLLAKAAERNGFREDSFVVLTLVITALQVPNLEGEIRCEALVAKQIESGFSSLLHVITQ